MAPMEYRIAVINDLARFQTHFTSPNTKMSQGLTVLLNSFVLRDKGKLQESKMSSWKW